MREAGLEPARPEWTLEPESSESANSTTRAYLMQNYYSKLFLVVNHKFGIFSLERNDEKIKNILDIKNYCVIINKLIAGSLP